MLQNELHMTVFIPSPPPLCCLSKLCFLRSSTALSLQFFSSLLLPLMSSSVITSISTRLDNILILYYQDNKVIFLNRADSSTCSNTCLYPLIHYIHIAANLSKLLSNCLLLLISTKENLWTFSIKILFSTLHLSVP